MLAPPGIVTNINPKSAKGTTIDLVLASPSLSHLVIETGPNLESDHLPIFINVNNPIKSSQSGEKKKWK